MSLRVAINTDRHKHTEMKFEVMQNMKTRMKIRDLNLLEKDPRLSLNAKYEDDVSCAPLQFSTKLSDNSSSPALLYSVQEIFKSNRENQFWWEEGVGRREGVFEMALTHPVLFSFQSYVAICIQGETVRN